MSKFIGGVIVLLLVLFAGVTLFFRFTTGSFTEGGSRMDALFGMAKERIAEVAADIQEEVDQRSQESGN